MPSLPKRHLGSIEVSAVSLGCMGLNHAYQPQPSEAQSIRLLNHALDAGVTMLDTAALYADGLNETLLAKAVSHRRNEFTLASKCVLGLFDGKRGLDGRPEAITRTLDGALDRLKTDHIDLYYLHRLDRNVPIEDSVGALARAVEVGKIGAIGLSEMSAATIRRGHAVHPIAAVQTEYSPCVRNAEIAVFDACAELGIGFVAFSPVCRGLLAGAIRGVDYPTGDLRYSLPRFVEPHLSHNLELRTLRCGGCRGRHHARPARAWLGAGAARLHRRAARHAQHRSSRRECRRSGNRVVPRDPGRGRCDLHAGGYGWRAVSAGGSGPGRYRAAARGIRLARERGALLVVQQE